MSLWLFNLQSRKNLLLQKDGIMEGKQPRGRRSTMMTNILKVDSPTQRWRGQRRTEMEKTVADYPCGLYCSIWVSTLYCHDYSLLTHWLIDSLIDGYIGVLVSHDSRVGEWMYLTVCPLHGPGLIPGHGGDYKRFFPGWSHTPPICPEPEWQKMAQSPPPHTITEPVVGARPKSNHGKTMAEIKPSISCPV